MPKALTRTCTHCMITVSSRISEFSSPAAKDFGALPRMNCHCLLTALANIQRQWLVSAPGVCPWGMLNLGWSQLGLPKWWMTTLQPSVPCPWRAVYPQRLPQMDFMAANSVSVRLYRLAIDQLESTGKFHPTSSLSPGKSWYVGYGRISLCLVALHLFNPAVEVKLDALNWMPRSWK